MAPLTDMGILGEEEIYLESAVGGVIGSVITIHLVLRI